MSTRKHRGRGKPAGVDRRSARAFATDLLEQYLTAPAQRRLARTFVREGAAGVKFGNAEVHVLAGPGGAAKPGLMRTAAALRLALAFGGNSAGRDGWPGLCAASLGALVDWDDLADRLLRRLVRSYAAAARPKSA